MLLHFFYLSHYSLMWVWTQTNGHLALSVPKRCSSRYMKLHYNNHLLCKKSNSNQVRTHKNNASKSEQWLVCLLLKVFMPNFCNQENIVVKTENYYKSWMKQVPNHFSNVSYMGHIHICYWELNPNTETDQEGGRCLNSYKISITMGLLNTWYSSSSSLISSNTWLHRAAASYM